MKFPALQMNSVGPSFIKVCVALMFSLLVPAQASAVESSCANAFLDRALAIEDKTVRLQSIGFSPSVANRIAHFDPKLADEILRKDRVRVLKAYRGLSIAPSDIKQSGVLWVQTHVNDYADGCARGCEGQGINLERHFSSIKDDGHKFWGVLMEFEIPDFLFTTHEPTSSMAVYIPGPHGLQTDIEPGSIGTVMGNYKSEFEFLSAITTRRLGDTVESVFDPNLQLRIPYDEIPNHFGDVYSLKPSP